MLFYNIYNMTVFLHEKKFFFSIVIKYIYDNDNFKMYIFLILLCPTTKKHNILKLNNKFIKLN